MPLRKSRDTLYVILLLQTFISHWIIAVAITIIATLIRIDFIKSKSTLSLPTMQSIAWPTKIGA